MIDLAPTGTSVISNAIPDEGEVRQPREPPRYPTSVFVTWFPCRFRV